MTLVDLDAVVLAGFAMAHAVWSVSDTTDDELLTPLAIVVRDGQRQLLRFEGDTQLQAIEVGKQTIAEQAAALEAWAFAREGAMRLHGSDDPPQDVISVEFAARDMPPAFAVLEFRRSNAANGFRLLGQPVFILEGTILESVPPALSDAFMEGIQSHAHASPLWTSWTTAIQ